MQVKAMQYVLEPGMSLYLVPETDVERTLLRNMWKYGQMELCNGCADNTGEGFAVTWKARKESEGEDVRS